jgi:hypothetical protein
MSQAEIFAENTAFSKTSRRRQSAQIKGRE